MDEFQLINRFFRRDVRADGVVLPLGDDAAVLAPSPGQQLVMSLDTLVEGRHFPADMPARDVGWRALAVNLSDLAAMGAEPRWCLLGLSVPAVDEAWLADFADGFFALADEAGIVLVGGDTVRGERALTVQVSGEVAPGAALTRAGARPGDRICIGGVPGLAALGLRQWQAGERNGDAIAAFLTPQPQLALGRKIRKVASACIDVSDGLLADLGHILAASGGCGAELRLSALPTHPALSALDDAERLDCQLAGGDDYLLLFTLPPVFNLPGGCHELGRVTAQSGIRVMDARGQAVAPARHGWNHFDHVGR